MYINSATDIMLEYPTLGMKLVSEFHVQFNDVLFIVVITCLSFFWLATLVLASHAYCFDLQ